MEIIWLPDALLDLYGVYEYYCKVAGEPVAKRQLSKIHSATQLLTKHPFIGHLSTLEHSGELLEWTIPRTPYVIPYWVIDDEIRICRVFDTRQEPVESWDV